MQRELSLCCGRFERRLARGFPDGRELRPTGEPRAALFPHEHLRKLKELPLSRWGLKGSGQGSAVGGRYSIHTSDLTGEGIERHWSERNATPSRLCAAGESPPESLGFGRWPLDLLARRNTVELRSTGRAREPVPTLSIS
jgi:hypothetical protein